MCFSTHICLPHHARIEKQFMEWKHSDSTIKKKFMAQWLVGKMMLTVFCDMKGTIIIDFLEKVSNCKQCFLTQNSLNLKAPFSIAGEGATPFSRLLHFTLDPNLIMLRVKQGGIKYVPFFESLVRLHLDKSDKKKCFKNYCMFCICTLQ